MAKVLVLVKHGQEEIETLSVVDFLRRAEIEVHMVSFEDTKAIQGAHDITYMADLLKDEITDFDGIYIPGGMPGTKAAMKDQDLLAFVRQAEGEGKLVAAMCAGPMVLDCAGVIKDRKFTCYPGIETKIKNGRFTEGIVVTDGKMITSRGPATAIFMALALIEEFLGMEKREEIAKDLLLPLVRKALNDHH